MGTDRLRGTGRRRATKEDGVRSRRDSSTGRPRTFLYVTAAISGGAILIVEILGARMLAPYFGTSHFVWTAQIIVTLAALAIGYDLGGRLADPRPRLSSLYIAILIAAAYLAGSAHVIEPVAWWCANLSLAVGSLAASMFLFFTPLVLLAMVGPFLARVLTTDIRRVGGRVGRLLAIGTLGSVGGAALVAYVLIPFVPYSRAMTMTAGLLGATTAAYFIGYHRNARHLVAAATLLTAVILTDALVQHPPGSIPSHMFERHRENTPYGLIQVIDTSAGERLLLTDFLVQNVYDPARKKGAHAFSYMLHGLARVYAGDVDDVLCIGMGIGDTPGHFADDGARVEVVEICPGIVRAAATYFDCDTDRFDITIADGRRFLRRTTNRHDVVILDAFSGDSSPSHLMTKEAFLAMRRLLRPGGILVVNAFADHRPGLDFLAASLEKTIAAAFGHVGVHSTDTGNLFFVASDRPLERRRVPDLDHVPAACVESVRLGLTNVIEIDPSSGLVLTDDFNPVEYHDAGIREERRRQFTARMRPD
jgi:spermidine synthase